MLLFPPTTRTCVSLLYTYYIQYNVLTNYNVLTIAIVNVDELSSGISVSKVVEPDEWLITSDCMYSYVVVVHCIDFLHIFTNLVL